MDAPGMAVGRRDVPKTGTAALAAGMVPVVHASDGAYPYAGFALRRVRFQARPWPAPEGVLAHGVPRQKFHAALAS